MKKGLVELVAILDMSGSMDGLTDDTIGGYNAMLREHRKEGTETLVTTYVFNQTHHMIHDREPIQNINLLTEKDYRPAGSTALLDTLGDAIHHIEEIHRYARIEDVPEHTIFVITTDGMENASCHYSSGEVKELVERKQSKDHWEFIYLASNIDAVENGSKYGFSSKMCIDVMPDAIGTANAYACANAAIRLKRSNMFLEEDDSWRRVADEDFLSRNK